jgi:TATA-binding protein-associated factor Taf7
MERYLCLKESGVVIGDAEESSSDSDDDDEDGDENEGDHDGDEDGDKEEDERHDTEAIGAGPSAKSHESINAEVVETIELIEKTQEEKVRVISPAKSLLLKSLNIFTFRMPFAPKRPHSWAFLKTQPDLLKML